MFFTEEKSIQINPNGKIVTIKNINKDEQKLEIGAI